jgi:acyl-CoA thioester hydrolase
MKKIPFKNITNLSVEKEIEIRFSEVDSMGIAWHGSYVKYFEDGRETFGKKYGISYLDVYSKNYMTPLVKLDIDYKKFIKYGDSAIIKTTLVDSDAAKIIFIYEVKRKSDNEIIAEGYSIQVFMNRNMELELLAPKFFVDWKIKYLNL